eukprot:3693204-Rhodomonas_salina.2
MAQVSTRSYSGPSRSPSSSLSSTWSAPLSAYALRSSCWLSLRGTELAYGSRRVVLGKRRVLDAGKTAHSMCGTATAHTARLAVLSSRMVLDA